jgi:hypothetical protein
MGVPFIQCRLDPVVCFSGIPTQSFKFGWSDESSQETSGRFGGKHEKVFPSLA